MAQPRNSLRIGIITSPVGEAARTPMSNLLAIISKESLPTYVITGNAALTFFSDEMNAKVRGINHREGKSIFMRILRHLQMQFRLALLLVSSTGLVDLWIFFIGGEALVIPMAVAKLTKKRILLALAGSDEQTLQIAADPISKLVRLSSRLSRRLSNRLVVYSSALVLEWHLEQYHKKISIAHHHFIDFSKFMETTKFGDRGKTIGFIGRMSEEKGIREFTHSIPLAVRQDHNLNFLMVGSGPLEHSVQEYLGGMEFVEAAKMTGWVAHQDLPPLLNLMKLVVIPSYTEGLPNVMLEAMASGTPVLATRVGGIPDVITEGETGFTMESNSPESISENVIRVLKSPNLELVSRQAREYVTRHFTFEEAVEEWRRVIRDTFKDAA